MFIILKLFTSRLLKSQKKIVKIIEITFIQLNIYTNRQQFQTIGVDIWKEKIHILRLKTHAKEWTIKQTSFI